jgi:hypothetical protein
VVWQRIKNIAFGLEATVGVYKQNHVSGNLLNSPGKQTAATINEIGKKLLLIFAISSRACLDSKCRTRNH